MKTFLIEGKEMSCLILVFVFVIFRGNRCENFITKKGYTVKEPTECLIQYYSDPVVARRVRCADLCTQFTWCYQFLYCPASRYCRINGVDHSDLLTKCDCYVEAGPFLCHNGGTLIGEKSCSCLTGYYGKRCEKIIRDCTEGMSLSLSVNREEESFIQPDGADKPFKVLCDFHYGFTQLLYRGPNSCGTTESFDRSWMDYVDGFGRLACEHWIGLEKLHLLTSQSSYNLEILVDDGGNYYQCYYAPFRVDSAATRYRASIPLTDTNALCNDFLRGGSGLDIDGNPFSTFDNDIQETGCPAPLNGGWWYGDGCSNSNMNGPYITQTQFNTNRNRIRLNVGGQFSNKWVKVLILRVEWYES